MKRIFFALLLFCSVASFAQVEPPTSKYTKVANGYSWLRGYFKALNLPVGPAPVLGVDQWSASGGIYLDTLNGDGTPEGLYLYLHGVWVFQGVGAFDSFDKLLNGGSVSYTGTGLIFNVTESLVRLCNNIYAFDSIQVTLPPGDPDFNKQYVIYLDSTGVHVKEGIPGTPAAVPQLEACQLALTTVLVEAGQTTPAITTQVIYDENTESTVANTGTTTNGANATNVFTGTVSTQVTNINNGDLVTWTKVLGGYWSLSGVDAISLAGLLRAQMPTLSEIRIQLFNGTSAVGGEVVIAVNKNNFTTYQQISIPISAFGTITNYNFNVVRIRYTSNNANNYTGYYFDRLELVSGLPQNPPASAVTSVGIAFTNGNAITVTNSPIVTSGNINLTFNGTAQQYIDGRGIKTTFPSIPRFIGPIDSRAKNDDGLTYDGDTLTTHLADRWNNGMLSKELWAKINRGDSIQNIGDGDTLLTQTNDSTLAIKSLKITGGTISTDDSTVTINVSGGGITASEGLVLDTDIKFGGLVSAPAYIYNNRNIMAGRKALIFGNGVEGAALWQFSDSAYSPFQFLSRDTITANNMSPSYARPLSGIFARREVYMTNGIYQQNKIHGHYVGQTWNWQDSMAMRTDGGDYTQALTVEQRYEPRGSGTPQVARISQCTGCSTSHNEGSPVLLVNNAIFSNGVDRLKINGTLYGVRSYITSASGYTSDTVNNLIHFTTGSNFPGKFLRTYIMRPSFGYANTDSAYGWYDTSRVVRSHHAGKYVFGSGPQTVSADQIKVYGNVNITDSLTLGTARTVTSTTGMDFILRKQSDGSLVKIDPSLIVLSGTRFGISGEDDTAGEDRVFNIGGQSFSLQLSDGGGFEIQQVESGGDFIQTFSMSPQNIILSANTFFGNTSIGMSGSGINFNSDNKHFKFNEIPDSALAGPHYMVVWNGADSVLYKMPLPTGSGGGGGGSGTVNSGAANRLAYYPSAATTVDDLAAITASRALVSDANGLPVAATTTTTQLNYLSTATSDIQTQLSNKQDAAGQKRIFWVGPGASTTIVTVGTNAFTTNGTLTTPALATTNLLTSTRRTSYSTGAVAGTVAKVNNTSYELWRGNAAGLGGFTVVYRFGLNTTVTGNRAIIGLVDNTTPPANIDPTTNTATARIGMCINAATGNWQFATNTSGAAPTVTDLGANFAVNTTDLLELKMTCLPNASSVDYVVTNLSTGNTTSGTASSNLPANTSFMVMLSWITNNAQSSAAILDVAKMYAETNY